MLFFVTYFVILGIIGLLMNRFWIKKKAISNLSWTLLSMGCFLSIGVIVVG